VSTHGTYFTGSTVQEAELEVNHLLRGLFTSHQSTRLTHHSRIYRRQVVDGLMVYTSSPTVLLLLRLLLNLTSVPKGGVEPPINQRC
jgi:hypothetical protein